MYPEEVPTTVLRAGQVGYIACNMKDSSEGERIYMLNRKSKPNKTTAHIGDTLHRVGESTEALPGFIPAKAMVGVSLTPCKSYLTEKFKGIRRCLPRGVK